MALRFSTPGQKSLFEAVINRLGGIGYTDRLLLRNYEFGDYFNGGKIERLTPTAAFGQTPPTYQTACFALLLSDKARWGEGLISEYRALGAPLAFEISDEVVNYWRVGKDAAATHRIDQFFSTDLDVAFGKYSELWRPDAMLRAKNIASHPKARQRTLFDSGVTRLPRVVAG